MVDIEGVSACHLSDHLPLREGAACPVCGKGRLNYNGLLELECPICGYRNSEGAGYS